MLNQYQQQLIDSIIDNHIVIGEACPGSGKTRTMEMAVSHLINDCNVPPSRIGVFTFSRKSAAEARRRIARTIIPNISEQDLSYLETLDSDNADPWMSQDARYLFIQDWVCTIHAMSYRILKANGYKLSMPNGKGKWEIDAIVKDGIKELDWQESPKAVWLWIANAINNLIEPSDSKYFFSSQYLTDEQTYNMSILFDRYISTMRRHGYVDFDMMQANLVKLIRSNDINISDMFDFVFIDEAQDNNSLQNEIIAALTTKAHLIMIGDVDQALYSFRGARPEIMRSIISGININLPINYRSTQAIVKASASLIANSYNVCVECHGVGLLDAGDSGSIPCPKCDGQENFLKPFQARPDAPEGQKLDYTECENFNDLIQEIIILLNNDYDDIAILSRTRAECAAIHTGLIAQDIPAINHSGGLLFGSPHIRKVLAYAHLACNYQNARDNLEILSEIANVASKHFLAPMTRRRHEDYCDAKSWQNCGCTIIMEEGIDYSHSRFYGQKAIQAAGCWQGILDQQYETNRGGYPSLNSKGAKDLISFVEQIETYKDDSRTALQAIIDDCILNWLQAEEGLSDEDLAENGKQEDFNLLLDMAEGTTLEQFLDKIEWLSKKAQSGRDGVNIGTVHWSKGTEFKRVIVNTTRLPLVIKSKNDDKLPTGRPPTVEEERRIMFVAVTRAKEICHLIGSQKWLDQTTSTSRFIMELGL